MTPSTPGVILLLLLIGLGFAVSGLLEVQDTARRAYRRWRSTIDLLVATAALADVGLAFVGEAARISLWALASLCLLAAATIAIRATGARPSAHRSS